MSGRCAAARPSVRLASARDAALFAVIGRPGIAPLSEDGFAALIGMPGGFALLAEDRGTPVGYLLARTAADESEIVDLLVAASARRGGIGRLLVEGAARSAAGLGARRMFLEVAVDNTAARALYAALDFREVGRRVRYYRRSDGDFVDAIVMRRDLMAGTSI